MGEPRPTAPPELPGLIAPTVVAWLPGVTGPGVPTRLTGLPDWAGGID